MKKQIIEMELIKECVGSNRYAAARGSDVQTLYIQKSALVGEKPPSKILVTIQESE